MQAFDPGRTAGTVADRPGTDELVGPAGQKSPDHGALSRALAADAVSAFAGVVEEMGRIREAHGEICGNLDRYADLLAQGGDGDTLIRALEDEVARLGEALGRFRDLSVSPEARSRLRDAGVVLASIDKCGHVLTAIASLMGTTIASLGLDNLEDFIAELRQTAENIRKSADDVMGQLAHLDERSRQLLGSCNRANAILDAMPARVAGAREALTALSADESRATAELTDRARGLTRDGRTHLNSFITAMQFSDRLAQRLDHLASMSVDPDGHVARLAAAQARRCAADIATVSQEVRATIRHLAELGHAGARVFSEGRLAEAIGQALAARAELAGMVTGELAKVQDVVELAGKEAACAAEMASATAGSFEGLTIASKNLALASFNSMLVSNRYSHACEPMKVLSKEVRQIASDSLTAVDLARGMIAQITEGSETAQQDLVGAADALRQRIDEVEGQSAAGERRLQDINGMRDMSSKCAQSLLFMVDGVTEAMGRVDAVGASLTRFAETLVASVPAGDAPDKDRINAIWNSYTMEEERQVHAEVFAGVPGLETSCAPATAGPADSGIATGDDDIDDMLF